jgi:hypothetical protein
VRHERRWGEQIRRSFEIPEVDDSTRVVHEEMSRLPERFQNVAVLCDLEGNSYAEAAQLLGCPVGTVMSRLSAARRRLRQRLARRGLAPAAGTPEALLAEQAGATTGALPQPLAEATIHAVLDVAQDHAEMAVVVSSAVDTLTEMAIKAMFLIRAETVAARLLTVAALCGVGFTVFAVVNLGMRAQAPNTALEKPRSVGPRVDGIPVSVSVRDAKDRAVPEAAVELFQDYRPLSGDDRPERNRPVPHSGRRPRLLGRRHEGGNGHRLFRELRPLAFDPAKTLACDACSRP